MGERKYPHVTKESVWTGMAFTALTALVILIAPEYAAFIIIVGAVAAVAVAAHFDYVKKNNGNDDSGD